MLPKPQVLSFRLKLALAAVLAISLCSPAQDVPRLALVVKEEMPVAAGLVRGMATTWPECDSAGNLYMQVIPPAPADSRAAPVTEISADGKHLTRFSLNGVPGVSPESSIDSFAVTPRGEVVVLARIGDLPQFVTFHYDGEFDSTYRIDRDIYAAHFAVFLSGEFLVRGVKVPDSARQERGQPFTGLFDRNGRFLKEVTVPDEIPFRSPGDFKDQDEFRKQDRGAEDAISNGKTFSADDGNVYVVRPTKSLSVDVVSPGGEIVRRLKLAPPNPSFRAGGIKVAGGKIVVEFVLKIPGDPQNRVSDFTYSVFDAENGGRLYDYYWPSGIPGFFSCYTPNYFTFLSIVDNGLDLVHASAR